MKYSEDVRRFTATLALLLAAALGLSQGRQLVFSEKSGNGQLWANLSLTYLRVDEPYLPMVVGVQNKSKRKAVISRESFRLVGPDGTRYPLAELREVRGEYDKFSADHRMASAAGIPVDVWYRQRHLRETNFFPDIRLSRRPTVIEYATLSRGDGMADLLYFVSPRGLAPGKPFLLEVFPEGWETPLRLRLVLGE